MKNRQVSCYFCYSKDTKLYLFVNAEYCVYKCNSCQLVFTFPQPVSMLDVNDTKYDSIEEKESRLAIFDKVYKRAQIQIQDIKQYKSSGKFLDIGCSYGICVKAAKDGGFDSYGIEPANSAATYAKKELHLNVFHGTLEKANIKNNTYDVITLFDVLEHIPDLDTFLKEVHRILKPGGLLVVQSPNVDSFAYRVLKVHWNWLLIPHHLWHFSYASLSNVLYKHGFSVKKGITEDNVYDFASNFRSTLHVPIFSSGLSFKVIRKIMYIISYGIIFVGTLLWSKQKKGGLLRVYAIKE